MLVLYLVCFTKMCETQKCEESRNAQILKPLHETSVSKESLRIGISSSLELGKRKINVKHVNTFTWKKFAEVVSSLFDCALELQNANNSWICKIVAKNWIMKKKCDENLDTANFNWNGMQCTQISKCDFECWNK